MATWISEVAVDGEPDARAVPIDLLPFEVSLRRRGDGVNIVARRGIDWDACQRLSPVKRPRVDDIGNSASRLGYDEDPAFGGPRLKQLFERDIAHQRLVFGDAANELAVHSRSPASTPNCCGIGREGAEIRSRWAWARTAR